MKRLFLRAFLLSYLLTLSGCNNVSGKAKLTFGNYISNDPFEITYSQAIDKMEAKENMLLASYYASIGACECQTVFYQVLKEYIAETNYNVYLFNSKEIQGSKDGYNLRNIGYAAPILYIINKGKVTATLSYTQKANEKIFTNKDDLSKTIDKYFTKPSYYYVDDAYLDQNLSKRDKVGLCTIRNSCSDCKYLIPNFMIPYSNENELSSEIWVFDIDEYKDTDKYQDIKDKYQLSETSNPKFGYLEGVVPTTQYYEKGILKDANVYLNDKVTYDNASNTYKITSTYYTSDRIQNLSYLDGEFVLLNKEIDKDELVSSYWLPYYASQIHNQIIKKFYDKYFL